MVVKVVFSILLLIIAIYSVLGGAYAVYDPLTLPNNKFGIHILFPSELEKAGELVNSNGGQWGYVTIPIQVADKDLVKWQKFFDEAKRLKIIPIIRLATESNYHDTKSWKKPSEEDILDFANFFDSLVWPTKNRYIVVFNEVNRVDEWEGLSNPYEYSTILDFAISTFKSKSDDYFIISAGLDNAAETDGLSFNEYDFIRLVNQENPGIFSRVDGVASHSYPNPAFSQPPDVVTEKSVGSFIYESLLIERLTEKSLPIFITETGWDQQLYKDSEVGIFFRQAFESIWNDPKIVAVTPFLLSSQEGPFEKFSFIKKDGTESDIFKAFQNIEKTKGEPIINGSVKNESSERISNLPVIGFSKESEDSENRLKSIIKFIFLGI